MLFNFGFFFVLPWILGIYILKKDKTSVLIGAPISMALTTLINEITYRLRWYIFTPLSEKSFAFFPANIGYFPIIGSLHTYIIRRYDINPYLLTLIMTGIETFFEFVAVKYGKIIYKNGWTLLHTAITYYCAHLAVYFYYTYVIKLINVNNRRNWYRGDKLLKRLDPLPEVF